MHAFAFDLQTRIGFCDLASGAHQLLEVFCAGREGQLMGYQRSGGRIVPQLREPTNSCVIQWGLDLVRETVRQVVEQFISIPEICSVESDLRPAIAALLSEFWHRPEPREAHAWGSFPSEDDQAVADRTPLARPFHTWEALSMLVPGRLAGASNKRIWEPGALAATSRPVRLALRAARRIAAVRSAVRRRMHFGRGGFQ
jgi:hypothetical protein